METPTVLLQADTLAPYATKGWWEAEGSSRFDELQHAFASFRKRFKVTLSLEDPSGFQDGSLLTRALELGSGPDVLGGFYFSRYGRLFTGGVESKSSLIQPGTWHALQESLSGGYGLRYVPRDTLVQRYSGLYEPFRQMTWEERFFSSFYVRLPPRSRPGAT